jgi:hypothetical protein
VSYFAGETLQDAVNEAEAKFRVPASIILVCLPTSGGLEVVQQLPCKFLCLILAVLLTASMLVTKPQASRWSCLDMPTWLRRGRAL